MSVAIKKNTKIEEKEEEIEEGEEIEEEIEGEIGEEIEVAEEEITMIVKILEITIMVEVMVIITKEPAVKAETTITMTATEAKVEMNKITTKIPHLLLKIIIADGMIIKEIPIITLRIKDNKIRIKILKCMKTEEVQEKYTLMVLQEIIIEKIMDVIMIEAMKIEDHSILNPTQLNHIVKKT